MITDYDLERKAIEAADFRADAEDGIELCRQLDDKYFREGIECYERNGESDTELWNDTQRDGYAFAAGLADNAPTFEFDFDIVAADIDAMSEADFMHFVADEMQAGRVLNSAQFEELDEQIGVYEERNRWQW